eukprot:5625528-Amphidinium_carterae.1
MHACKARLWGRAADAIPVALREPQHWLRMPALQPIKSRVAPTPREVAPQHESVSAAADVELYDRAFLKDAAYAALAAQALHRGCVRR